MKLVFIAIIGLSSVALAILLDWKLCPFDRDRFGVLVRVSLGLLGLFLLVLPASRLLELVGISYWLAFNVLGCGVCCLAVIILLREVSRALKIR